MDIGNLTDIDKIDRIFRARNKIYYPQACCHVTQRAPGRELLFIEDSDYLYLLHLLKEKAKKFNFEIFTFALLPNHFHLQVRLREANLSAAMKNICESYAKIFNKKYNRKGHVFSGAYRQALCFDDSYLLATSLYINLNPVKAGLVINPQDYRWSSCRLYVSNSDKETFVNYKFILKILHEDIEAARQIYNRLLKQSISIKTAEVWNYPYAIDKFRWRLMRLIKPLLDRSPDSKKNIFKEVTLDEKIRKIKKNKYKIEPVTIKARVYLIEQMRSNGYKMDEIAKRLNLSRKTLYNAIMLYKTSIA